VNVSEVFIKRPIATSLTMLGIAMFGVVAYRALPVSDLPQIDFPTINVNAALPGGDPSTMASAVATPLERQFTTIAGLDSMVSSSGMGGTNITMQFALERDIDSAAVDVQSAIAAVMPLLPAGMSAPPSFKKTNPADQPIMRFSLASRTVPRAMLDDYAENLLANRISAVEGVSQVQVSSGSKYAVRVQVDPDKLRAQHIGINDVDQALQNWNVNLPTGQLYGREATYNLKLSGQLNNAADFQGVVIGYQNGRPVRLDQVATIIDSVEDIRGEDFYYTKSEPKQRHLGVTVFRQPGANTIEVSTAVHRLMPQVLAQIPPTVHAFWRYDKAESIRQGFKDIQITMAVTLGLVIGVIFLFLHNLRATIIPALALPFSLLGTFAVMQVLHFSLNNLSMMALILSIGFIVDDAIVMLENIVRHLEGGAPALQAALQGSQEIGFTILTMTTSLAAVFIPILFMSGVLGRLFREFAVTITSAILISGLVSVTLTPMLCSRFLKTAALHGKGPFSTLMERIFNWFFDHYKWSLGWVLRYRPLMVGVFFAIIVATVYMFEKIPKGFIPDTDNDTASISLRAAQGTSYDDMVKWVQRVADIVIKNPYIDGFGATAAGMGGGGGNPGFSNRGNMGLMLTPRATRPVSAGEILNQIRPQISQFPSFRAFASLPPALQIGGRIGDQNYSLVMQSLNTEELFAWAPRIEAAVSRVPEVMEVSTDLELKSPRVDLLIDRDKAAALGLDATQIENVLYSGYGPKWSSTIYGPQTQYKVLLEVDPKYQSQTDALEHLAFKTNTGGLVPLTSILRMHPGVGPQTISHTGQLPSVSVSFGLRPGVSLGTATTKVKAVADRLLPPTITTSFEGSAKAFQDSLNNLSLLLCVAIGVVYIVLGALYESYIHPLTILAGLPSAGLGALLTLWVFHDELNVYSFVGLIMLIGIVKKNAIMQIDFALETERQHGKTPAEAIYDGCLIRFRPIMMTTMAALLGSIPIALGYGSGGEARRPLGLAVVGGLLVSQAITLYLTPVVYTYMAAVFKTRKISTFVASEAATGVLAAREAERATASIS
jgi:HAE1 family hydrophobic/amphiphilic exporter-1